MKNATEQSSKLGSDYKAAMFKAKQKESYEFKVRYAEIRAWEFYRHPEIDGNCFVAVGGLDSITLLLFLRSIGIHVPAVSVSVLEDKSIQRIHKELGVIPLKPLKSKVEVIREFGWPVISKRYAVCIHMLQNPSHRNEASRYNIIHGEKQDGSSASWKRLPKKWLDKFYYKQADFSVSDKCCQYMKENPCKDYAKNSGLFPYLGLMASEGGRRERALMVNGCNYISPGTKRSCPFAIFSRQDLLQLALDLNAPVPEIYGKIVRDADGTLRTTKAQRTG